MVSVVVALGTDDIRFKRGWSFRGDSANRLVQVLVIFHLMTFIEGIGLYFRALEERDQGTFVRQSILMVSALSWYNKLGWMNTLSWW
jgi:hypothetical protein